MDWVRQVALAGLVIGASGCDGCRGTSPPATDAAPVSVTEPVDDDASDFDGGRRDASARFRDAEPMVDASRAVAPIDAACSGKAIDLAAAVFDERCAIGSSEAKRLREPLEVDAGAPRFRQEAALDADGNVVVRVVNLTNAPLVLPLSHHGKLPAFTGLAEDDAHHLFELEPPTIIAPAKAEKPRIAKIELAPGGVASVRATVVPRVLHRLVPKCASPDAGVGCAPGPLPRGTYTLYVGQLVIDVEVGAPARVAWTVP